MRAEVDASQHYAQHDDAAGARPKALVEGVVEDLQGKAAGWVHQAASRVAVRYGWVSQRANDGHRSAVTRWHLPFSYKRFCRLCKEA